MKLILFFFLSSQRLIWLKYGVFQVNHEEVKLVITSVSRVPRPVLSNLMSPLPKSDRILIHNVELEEFIIIWIL